MKYLFPKVILSLTLLITALVLSCKKEDDPEAVPEVNGQLRIQFDNVVGSEPLELTKGTYKNSVNEAFTVTIFNYYVSNFRLLKADGTSFTIPKDSSYFLIRENNTDSQTITLKNIPDGDYTGLEFIVGVDSLKSIADASQRKGVLDPLEGPTNEEAMYWDWNPGYIFLKMEGSSPAATSANGKYYYHIGGFGGRTEKTINNIRTAKISFGSQKATVTEIAIPEVRLKADVSKIFDGSTKLSIAANGAVMFTDFSTKIADNYINMFSFDQVHAN